MANVRRLGGASIFEGLLEFSEPKRAKVARKLARWQLHTFNLGQPVHGDPQISRERSDVCLSSTGRPFRPDADATDGRQTAADEGRRGQTGTKVVCRRQ